MPVDTKLSTVCIRKWLYKADINDYYNTVFDLGHLVKSSTKKTTNWNTGSCRKTIIFLWKITASNLWSLKVCDYAELDCYAVKNFLYI